MRRFSTAITEFTARDDGIVVGREVNLGVARTTQSVTESLDRLREETRGKRPPGLWDARSVPEFAPEVWTAFLARIEQVVIALAILADERVAKVLGAFPTAMDSLLLPVRVFSNEDEAVEWLLQYVDQEGDPSR